jgi:hypothetical protein
MRSEKTEAVFIVGLYRNGWKHAVVKMAGGVSQRKATGSIRAAFLKQGIEVCDIWAVRDHARAKVLRAAQSGAGPAFDEGEYEIVYTDPRLCARRLQSAEGGPQ